MNKLQKIYEVYDNNNSQKNNSNNLITPEILYLIASALNRPIELHNLNMQKSEKT